MEEDDECGEHFVILTILSKGCTFNYFVPSFPVFNVNLMEAKFQWEDGNGEAVHIFDGFACDCNEIDHPLPAVVKIYYSCENVFIEVRRILKLDNAHCLLYVLCTGCIFVLI